MQNKYNKIGILGLGAIGSVIAFDLQKNKSNELYYYGRTKINELKIKIKKVEFEIPISLETNTYNSPKLDWLIICIKEHQYSEAKKWFTKLISNNTKVVIIRNGLRLKEPLLEFANDYDILECIIDCPTEVSDKRVYEPLKQPILTIKNSPLAIKLKNIFNKSQSDIRLIDDFKSESWKKLIESSALGSILCLSGETCWIFENKKFISLYAKIIKESLKVALADGAKIESSFVDDMKLKLMSYPKTKGSSMLTDRLKGNTIELGAKNGIISELGRRYNIETPINDLIIDLLELIMYKTQNK
ncbi:MAG: hypothetical protein HRT66_05505 [Flavobacteriaceae bacterium]|nr:hypothetical protein [Flavobacteriaceae bacterium]